MTELELYRQWIDEVDAQLAELFEKRFAIVKNVIAYKTANNIPVQDTGREAVIIEKNTDRITNSELRPYFKKWYEEMIALSREYQEDIRKEKERKGNDEQ
ncbi:MAG: chorismate mutase [Solobacterium sp.]|nr:chorismate mutase [Solobacterium sp.]